MIRTATALCLLAGALATQAQNNPGKPGMPVNPDKQVFEAKLFAKGTISTPNSNGITFTPDGKTAYFDQRIFAQRRSLIMESQFQDGKWSAPVLASFSGQYVDSEPFISPDGSQMFFTSDRPHEGHQEKHGGIWVVDKTDKGWSEPRDLGDSINGGFPSVAANGNLYFFAPRPDSPTDADIYRARRVGKTFGMPENLGPEINSARREYDAYVAPDESYIIFVSSRFGRADLYISTRKNGVWTTPRNLGPGINDAHPVCCPTVSPDGKTFFFTSGSGGLPEGPGIYQIDIRALGLDRK